jgi:copper chaperone CopZ
MKATVIIQNLKCDGCINSIQKKLSALHGIDSVSVNLEESKVSFDYENELNLLDAKETLKIMGYPEVGQENSLGRKAKSYVSCAIGRMS